MTKKGIEPNVVTFNSLIAAMCKCGQSDNATRLLESMISSGISPDIITYTVLLDGLYKSGRSKEALNHMTL